MDFFDVMDGIDYKGFSVGTEICEVVCDTRLVQPGTAFVAIRGAHSDGHDLVTDALEAGAAFIVVEKDMGLPLQIVVKNTRQAYALMCANLHDRPSEKLHLIGVTGTNGKTTVTTIIWQMLTAMGKKVGLIGTTGNQIGNMTLPARYTTPEAGSLQAMLARMVEADCEYAILEVSSHSLEQHRLDGCHFDVGVFTNLTQDHLDYHKTMEAYFEAKSKLFEQADCAIINGGDPYGQRAIKTLQARNKTVFSYGVDTEEGYMAKNVEENISSVSFLLCHETEQEKAYFGMPGRFSASNALAALATVNAIGFSLSEAVSALEKCTGVKGRAEVISRDLGLPFTVVRDYAHSEDGLSKILEAFRGFVPGQLIVVFGAPGERDVTKRPLMGQAVAEYADYAIITSDNPRSEDEKLIMEQVAKGFQDSNTPFELCEDRFEAIKRGMERARTGDLLLLAGKGHEEYQVLSYGTLAFDEKEVVKVLAEEGIGKYEAMESFGNRENHQ